MIKSALSYIVGLGKDAATNQLFDIDGVQFSGNGLNLSPVMMPEPDRLDMTTLTGLVDYVAANRDELGLAKMVVVVDAPDRVTLRGPLMHATQQRPVYVQCKPLLPTIKLEEYQSSEQLNLMLQSCFVNTEDRATLISFTACVTEESSITTTDDGVGQSVVAKVGIARRSEVIAPSPINLRPFRTFTEIEQPESPFVLRMRSTPLAMGLFGADGGAWRNAAIASIKQFLVAKLDEALEETSASVTVLA